MNQETLEQAAEKYAYNKHITNGDVLSYNKQRQDATEGDFVAGANWQRDNGYEPKWQLCPKCNEEGNLPNTNPYVTTAPMTVICHVCNGAKILPSPPKTI